MSEPNITTENDPSGQAGTNALFELAILSGLGLEIARKLEKLGQVHESIAFAMAMDLAIRKARIDLSAELDEAKLSLQHQREAFRTRYRDASNAAVVVAGFHLLDRVKEAETAVVVSQQALDEAMQGAPQNDFSLEESFELAVGMLDVYLAGRSQPPARKVQTAQRPPMRRPSRPHDPTIRDTYREQINPRTTCTVLAGAKRPSPSESEEEG